MRRGKTGHEEVYDTGCSKLTPITWLLESFANEPVVDDLSPLTPENDLSLSLVNRNGLDLLPRPPCTGGRRRRGGPQPGPFGQQFGLQVLRKRLEQLWWRSEYTPALVNDRDKRCISIPNTGLVVAPTADLPRHTDRRPTVGG